MRSGSFAAGIGALAFAVLTFVGMIIASPPGGTYSAHDVEKYTAHGHRFVVFFATYLVLLGAMGLIVLVTRLREMAGGESWQARASWGAGVAAAVAFASGWTVVAAVPMAMAYGGKDVAVEPTVAYVIAEAGYAMMFGAGGVLLGFALLAWAFGARAAAPGWVRWITVIAGILGLASLAWFPFFGLLIWALVIGLWLIAGGRGPAAATA
jgi:hypothetical protein